MLLMLWVCRSMLALVSSMAALISVMFWPILLMCSVVSFILACTLEDSSLVMRMVEMKRFCSSPMRYSISFTSF